MNMGIGIFAALGFIIGQYLSGNPEWMQRAFFGALGCLLTGVCCQLFSRR